MTNVFHQQRYRNLTVEDAIPLDSLSCISSDHIYAEIGTPPDTPPLLPPRADTPIINQAPDYPPAKDNCGDLELVRQAPATVSTCLVRSRPVDQVEGEVDG